MVIEYKPVERHMPASLKRPCDPAWSKAGGAASVADLVDRGDVNETGLTKCAAQMRKVAEWDRT